MKIPAFAALAVVLSVGPASGRTVSIPGSDDPADFAWTLYRKVAALTPGRNALVSPYSAREAAGLAYAGARGATAEGLAKALRAGRLEDFLEAAKKTREELAGADRKTTIEDANSLWLRSKSKFRGSYVARARRDFDADVFRREFSPKTVAEADAWVSGRTRGKITKAVEKLDPQAAAVLLNAIYFKGVWKRPFDKAKTRERDFHLASGRIVRRPLMAFGPGRKHDESSRRFDYAEDSDLQAVRLPYGSGRIAMVVVLPAKGTALPDLASKLDGTRWRALRASFQEGEGDVELPRFKFEASTTLTRPLIEMGATLAFDPVRADFGGMAAVPRGDAGLFISEVRQTAMIEVDEKGTVAAAKSSVSMPVGGMGVESKPFSFIADRPFLFAIEDEHTGTLLFIGSVQDPR